MDSFQLQLNESTQIDGNNCTSNVKKRKIRPYKCIFEFEGYKSALERMAEPIDESSYTFRYTRPSIEGDKDFYHCRGHQKCPKTLYILRHSDSLNASIWICSMPHVHKETNGSTLPQKSVAHIKMLFAEKTRFTNNEIINSLRRHNCPQLTKTQINNVKSRLKHKRIG